jgi:BirA family biotin operon repressor/biotin-[acetyl-CoA-carboxylase] ligase
LNPTRIPDDVAEALSRAEPRLGPLGARVLWYDEIASTNDRALTLAEAGVPEGTLVLADAQSAGRGRQGRSWASPAGAGIYASAVLRPPPHGLHLLTIAAGLAVAEGIQAATGLHARVKWPNDVYVDTPRQMKKVAGLLAEAGTATGGVHVVLGFGINILPAAYPPDVAARATSIESELGRHVSRGLVLAECLAAIWQRHTALIGHRGGEVLTAWRGRAAATFGRRVEWDAPEGRRAGIARDVDAAGALLVETGAEVVRLTAGEVRWTE